MKIRIVADKQTLTRIWDEKYGETSGKVFEVEQMSPDGTAITKDWSFARHLYEILKEDTMIKRRCYSIDEALEASRKIVLAGFNPVVTLYRPIDTEGDTAFGSFEVVDWLASGVDWKANAYFEADGERWQATEAEEIWIEVRNPTTS